MNQNANLTKILNSCVGGCERGCEMTPANAFVSCVFHKCPGDIEGFQANSAAVLGACSLGLWVVAFGRGFHIILLLLALVPDANEVTPCPCAAVGAAAANMEEGEDGQPATGEQ